MLELTAQAPPPLLRPLTACCHALMSMRVVCISAPACAGCTKMASVWPRARRSSSCNPAGHRLSWVHLLLALRQAWTYMRMMPWAAWLSVTTGSAGVSSWCSTPALQPAYLWQAW